MSLGRLRPNQSLNRISRSPPAGRLAQTLGIMKKTVSILVTVFAFGSGSGQAFAATECTQREAYAAEVNTDYLDSWANVYQFFKQFRHCYDASIAEGAEDKIQVLWATRWSAISQMIALTKKDSEFKTFIWQRITDETFPQERFAVFVRNAKTSCPEVAAEFCRAVIKAAAQPINPPDAAR
jgi:hypothetical protein